MDEKQRKHRLNVADVITSLRIAGAILLLGLRPLSAAFFWVYALTGLTDVLDGWVARKTKTASEFGARLDSFADLFFYLVIFFCTLPVMLEKLSVDVWCAVATVFCIRVVSYGTVAIKYRRFASLHTYLNKLTGLSVFFIPFFLTTDYAVVYCRFVSVIAVIASLEELYIHIRSKEYSANVKSVILCRK